MSEVPSFLTFSHLERQQSMCLFSCEIEYQEKDVDCGTESRNNNGDFDCGSDSICMELVDLWTKWEFVLLGKWKLFL